MDRKNNFYPGNNMQENEIIAQTSNLMNFLRGLETKSIADGNVSGDFIIDSKPFFFDTSSNNDNFFFKHAQCIQTNLPSINIAIPSGFLPKWKNNQSMINIKPSEFEGKTPIVSITLKNLIYSMIITDDMKKDIQLDLQDYFINHIKKIMNKTIIQTLIYGDSDKYGPIGILSDMNNITIVKSKNTAINDILELMDKGKNINIHDESILIMNNIYYAKYLSEIINEKITTLDRDNFMGIPIYITDLLKEKCILVNLKKSMFLAFNPSVALSHKQELFHSEIGIKTQIGTFIQNTKENILLLQ